jgi:hypothetical protein
MKTGSNAAAAFRKVGYGSEKGLFANGGDV